MLEYLPQDIRDGLAAAHKAELKRKSRLQVRFGGTEVPVLRLWDGGFALDADQIRTLRGLVNLCDGERLVCQCLVVRAVVDAGELVCEFKRATPPADHHESMDFWQDEPLPQGFIPRG